MNSGCRQTRLHWIPAVHTQTLRQQSSLNQKILEGARESTYLRQVKWFKHYYYY